MSAAAAAATTATGADQQCVEVAIFRTSGVTNEVQRHACTVFSGYPGYVVGLGLVHPNDSDLRADIVLWATLQAALNAAEKFKTDADVAAYASAITSLDVFGHYRTTAEFDVRRLATAAAATLTVQIVNGDEAKNKATAVAIAGLTAAAPIVQASLAAVTPEYEKTGMTPAALQLQGWTSEAVGAEKASKDALIFTKI